MWHWWRGAIVPRKGEAEGSLWLQRESATLAKLGKAPSVRARRALLQRIGHVVGGVSDAEGEGLGLVSFSPEEGIRPMLRRVIKRLKPYAYRYSVSIPQPGNNVGIIHLDHLHHSKPHPKSFLHGEV